MLLDIVIPGVSFEVTPGAAQVFWVAFFVVVIALAAIGAPRSR